MKNITLLLAALTCGGLALLTRRSAKPQTRILANIAEGIHEEFVTRYPAQPLPVRYLIAKVGEDANTAAICGAGEKPLGIFYDETRAADGAGRAPDLGLPVAVAMLGASDETRRVAINSTVAEDDWLVPAAGGYAQSLPETPGVYYVIGRALRAGNATADYLEFDPQPQRIIVPAPFTPSNADGAIGGLTISNPPTQAELIALRDKCEATNDGVRQLKAILDDAGITHT